MYSFRSWGPPPASRASRLPRARSSMLCSSGVPGEVISVVQAYIVFSPKLNYSPTYIYIYIHMYTYIYITHSHWMFSFVHCALVCHETE